MAKWCLITGGSKGIGYEFAKLFANDGYNLVLVARSADRLYKIKNDFEKQWGIDVLAVPLDLIKPGSINILMKEIEKRDIKIDILINNAGFGTSGNFVGDSIENDMNIICLNIEVLTELTHIFLKKMLKKRAGKILNVASVAAFMPGPLSAVYFGTKSYVLNFSLGIAEEVRGSGVSVTTLCPGFTKTDFISISHMERAKLVKWTGMSPSKVAKIGYKGLIRGDLLAIPGVLNKILIFGSRILPFKALIKIVKFAMLP